MIVNNFCFLVDFIRPTGPMVTMATRYTGGLSHLILVETSCEKKFRVKPTSVFYMVKFINTPPPLICQGGCK